MTDNSPLALYRRLDAWLWRDCDQAPLAVRIPLRLMRIAYAVMRDLANGQLSLRAMSLVYTTLISLVPLLALSFSVLKGFGVHNQIEPALLKLLEPLGDKRFDVVSNLIGFVDNIKVGVLGAVGLALLIYSVIAMMQKIEGSFNYTWQIKRGRSFSQRFSDYLSVILTGPLLIFLSIGITATVRSHVAIEYLASLPGLSQLLAWLGILIPYLLMAAAFAFIYFFIPNTRVRIGSAFVGGLVTAIAWKLMGWLFALFIAGSSNQTAIYSAFASAILLMVWLYLGWLMLLVGASIAFYHQNPQNLRVRKDQVQISAAAEETLLLTISLLVAERFARGEPGYSLDELGQRLQLPRDWILDGIDKLEAAGFLLRTQQTPMRLVPARPLEQLSPLEISRALRTQPETTAVHLPDCSASRAAQQWLQERQQLADQHLGAISYAALITQTDASARRG